jgi:hypothetical protein
MLFTDLLRITVLLSAGVGSGLIALAVLVAQREQDSTVLIVGGVWWALAVVIGLIVGRRTAAGEAMSRALAGARTALQLPAESPTRIAVRRLWPIGLFVLVCGATGMIWPQIAAIAGGWALLVALAWRKREAAVQAIEDRDGVRFYVEPTSAFKPVKLIRTPGLYRDRPPRRKPPPPPPETEAA